MLDILNNISSEVLTESDKATITNKFNEAVEAKVNEAVSAEKEVIKASLEESYNVKLEEAIEAEKASLVEEYDAKMEGFKSKILESLDKYCEDAVQNLVEEIKDSLQTDLDQSQYDNILETYRLGLISAGVKMNEVENAIVTESSNDYDRLSEKYDALVEEKRELENKLLISECKAIIAEATEGMSLVKASKFEKVASLIDFDSIEDFKKKVDVLKESEDEDDDELDEKKKLKKESDSEDDLDDKDDLDKKKKLKESKLHESWKRFI